MNDIKLITDDGKPFTLYEISEICNKLSDYAKENIGTKDCFLESILRSSDTKNNRYDIELRYIDENRCLTGQKLLYMKGEIIDGIEFHKRFNEFYPETGEESLETEDNKDIDL